MSFFKFPIFILLLGILIVPEPLFSATDPSQTVKPAYWGGYGEPNRAEKHDFVSERYYILETGMGESKISQITDTKILRYFKIAGVHGPQGQCSKSDGSNAISESTHPAEWALWERVIGDPNNKSDDLLWYADIDGNPSTPNQPMTSPEKNNYNAWCYIDITNPEKRARWSAALIQYIAALTDTGRNGIDSVQGSFIDNARIPFPGYADIDIETDPTLSAKMYEGMYEIIRSIRTAFPQDYIIINAYNNRDEVLDTQRGEELLQAGADAMMCEVCSFKNNGKFYETSRYNRTISDLYQSTSGSTGLNMPAKDVVTLDRIENTDDYDYRMYSLASYLLVANNQGNAYFVMSTPMGWSDVPDYPEHSLDLGKPLGKYAKRHGLFIREYEKGTVVLNPSQQRSVSLEIGTNKEQLRIRGGGTWVPGGNGGTLSWQSISSSTFEVTPNSAFIYRSKN